MNGETGPRHNQPSGSPGTRRPQDERRPSDDTRQHGECQEQDVNPYGDARDAGVYSSVHGARHTWPRVFVSLRGVEDGVPAPREGDCTLGGEGVEGFLDGGEVKREGGGEVGGGGGLAAEGGEEAVGVGVRPRLPVSRRRRAEGMSSASGPKAARRASSRAREMASTSASAAGRTAVFNWTRVGPMRATRRWMPSTPFRIGVHAVDEEDFEPDLARNSCVKVDDPLDHPVEVDGRVGAVDAPEGRGVGGGEGGTDDVGIPERRAHRRVPQERAVREHRDAGAEPRLDAGDQVAEIDDSRSVRRTR